jgi:hypothetical protein
MLPKFQKIYSSITESIKNTAPTKEIDGIYRHAINTQNKKTIQQLVNNAAKMAGYQHKVFHGTNDNFTTFDPNQYLTDRDQLSGPGINTTTSKEEASNYGHRIIAAFIKTENPANIKYNIYELLTHKERLEAESTLEPNETVISRRLLNGSIEPYGNQFVIKSKSRLDLGFLHNPPFEGPINSQEKALQVFKTISNGSVHDLHHSISPKEKGISSYGAMNRKIIEILQRKGYDGITMSVRKDDSLHHHGSLHRIVFNPNQIKLADPITYDNNNNIIPISQRFNPNNQDIRY